MSPHPSPNAAGVLATIHTLSAAAPARLVPINDLCKTLGVERSVLEPVLLQLQNEGRLLCTPSSGRIAMVTPVRERP